MFRTIAINSTAALAVALALAIGCPGSTFAAPGDIIKENALPGVPPSEWDVEGSGDSSLQGFATDISVNRGETVHLKISTDAPTYDLEIFRLGYYGGAGARRMAAFRAPPRAAGVQPPCLEHEETGLIDCGNWAVSASWTVPADAISGVYVAKLTRPDTGGASHIMFIVRDDDGDSELLVQTSDTTWQAYNDYRGNSLYVGKPDGRAYKVSYNRPMILRGTKYARASFWANEYPMVRWLEANGYDVSYTTGVDTARRGELLRRHKVFMSVGHDEYWSAEQRAHVEAARDAGVHLAFFSGNAIFWKTRWEPSIDETRTPHRTLVCYKETHAGRKLDPTGLSTSTWRDPRFSLPTDGGRPENALKGSLFVTNCCRFDSIVVSAEQGRRRFWRHTDVAELPEGGTTTIGLRTVGYEWDADIDNGFRPAGVMRLSNTTLSMNNVLRDFGSKYDVGVATHSLTLYRHPSGALVFSTGSIVWSWALDPMHDDPDGQQSPVDPRLQQATVNILADMNVMPRTPQSGLVVSGPSEDATPPAAVIESPASEERHTFHLPVRVTGIASDEGGVPSGVEVSVDSGASWRRAEGAARWTFEFTPRERGAVTILARAVDDSGNLQTIPAFVTIHAVGYSKLARVAAPIVVGLGLLVVVLWWLRRRATSR